MALACIVLPLFIIVIFIMTDFILLYEVFLSIFQSFTGMITMLNVRLMIHWANFLSNVAGQLWENVGVNGQPDETRTSADPPYSRIRKLRRAPEPREPPCSQRCFNFSFVFWVWQAVMKTWMIIYFNAVRCHPLYIKISLLTKAQKNK